MPARASLKSVSTSGTGRAGRTARTPGRPRTGLRALKDQQTQ
ncbi:hypothetical protein STTU_0844 [Streptomyces sp. Tu6071]|nr:predicted protein [Streptomyces sp. SPB78]EGJ73633.1 hypothetical protein STTU_0844 [Streptomyces sp. Tu6071]